jgi:hypothetical protein
MIDLDLIGKGTPSQHDTCVYLNWDRASALADFILSRYGLEVPLSFDMPSAREIEADVGWSHNWPRRVVVSRIRGMADAI